MVVDLDAIERLGTVVREAGAAALVHYTDEMVVSEKADRSPLTEADRAAHRVIAAALADWTPSVPVVSEEGEIPPWSERRTWHRFWLVDPLDGTKEFIKRNGEFTVNVALIEGTGPIMGAVYAPALDRLYVAGLGLGAWKSEGSAAPVRIASSALRPGAPLVVVESRSHPSPELEAFLASRNVGQRIKIGSSLKFCLLAEGSADLYPRFGPTMEWDTAAGDCVFRASGRDGERPSPLTYNTPTLRHEPFVIGE